MSNFGFTQLRLVTPYEVAFKEARSAVHSQYILENAQVFPTVGEAVADCFLVAGTTAAARRDLPRQCAFPARLELELVCPVYTKPATVFPRGRLSRRGPLRPFFFRACGNATIGSTLIVIFCSFPRRRSTFKHTSGRRERIDSSRFEKAASRPQLIGRL